MQRNQHQQQQRHSPYGQTRDERRYQDHDNQRYQQQQRYPEHQQQQRYSEHQQRYSEQKQYNEQHQNYPGEQRHEQQRQPYPDQQQQRPVAPPAPKPKPLELRTSTDFLKCEKRLSLEDLVNIIECLTCTSETDYDFLSSKALVDKVNQLRVILFEKK